VTSSSKVLVVLHRDDDLAWLSLRNAASVHPIAVDQLNAYDVLVNDEVVFTSAALAAYVSGPASGRSAKAVASESELTGTDLIEPSTAELADEADAVDDRSEPDALTEPEAEGDVK